jgi:hypothetical protein
MATTKKGTADGRPLSNKTIVEGDPLGINRRLYAQVGKLLDDMERADRDETMTFPQRISALIAVGRIQKMMMDLRKGEFSAGGGSAVERYAAAFQTPHAIGGGNDRAGPANIVQFDRSSADDDSEDEFDT